MAPAGESEFPQIRDEEGLLANWIPRALSLKEV